ncbi:hypothetical protein SM033_00303 [Vibrio phage vB_VpaM_sm033]|nr:hypothetical protein SM033_00303 [Vibrio phage vB_VpaM_sm033]
MLRQVSRQIGTDSRAQGKFKPTEYNTALLVEAFFDAVIKEEITEIPGVGRFTYDSSGKITRFSPVSSFSKHFLNNTRVMSTHAFDENEIAILANKTGLLRDDIELALSSLTTYMLEQLADHHEIMIPNIGKISFSIIVTSRPRATFEFEEA